jgi:hypothetical protein
VQQDEAAYFQSHQKTFSLHIRKAEIDASWVAVGIAISNNLLNLCIDALD